MMGVLKEQPAKGDKELRARLTLQLLHLRKARQQAELEWQAMLREASS